MGEPKEVWRGCDASERPRRVEGAAVRVREEGSMGVCVYVRPPGLHRWGRGEWMIPKRGGEAAMRVGY